MKETAPLDKQEGAVLLLLCVGEGLAPPLSLSKNYHNQGNLPPPLGGRWAAEGGAEGVSKKIKGIFLFFAIFYPLSLASLDSSPLKGEPSYAFLTV